MENNNDNHDLKKRLAALLYMFKDKPHILVDYFSNYDALKQDFKDRLLTNKNLEQVIEQMENDKNIEKPYFTNVNDMQNFYNGFFTNPENNSDKKPHPVLGSTDEEVLRKQLSIVIESEDYEKAAKIRDYMKKLGYKI